MRRLAVRAAFALFALIAFVAVAVPASARPSRIWVAWLDGRSLEDALATKATVLDRFPDALVLGDEFSATTLRDLGWRVEAPVALPPGGEVTLLRDDHGTGGATASDLQAVGATLLWSGGLNRISASPGVLPESKALLAHHRKALRMSPLAIRKPAETPVSALATVFSDSIQAMVDRVSGATMMDHIRDLAGSRSVLVGGSPVTFNTRATPTAKCDQAEQFVFERLQAMGFADVQYDPYTFSTTSARNVVATLPGAVNPQRVVLLGAHLDSTSPDAATVAPGANDNASGVAGMLVIADILRRYSFENTIRFVAFTGEEQGLYGSRHYANAALARGDSIVGVVIFDMIAWKAGLHQIDIEGETAWLPIMNVMRDACARYTGVGTTMVLNSWGSDHVPFQDVGYPAFLAIESDYPTYPCYHQTCDTTGWNQAALGADVMKGALATLAHLAVPHEATFAMSHTPLPNTTNATGPYDVSATFSLVAPLLPDSLRLHWSNGGPWNVVPLLPGAPAGSYHAAIPGQSPVKRVQYWIEAVDSTGARRTSPSTAPGAVHTFWVGAPEVLFSEGFESGAGGWTHGGANDDWQFAPPQGRTGDPTLAYAGTGVAGTDLTGLGTDLGKYENGSDTWLESPAIDCSAAGQVRLSFARWLNVERSNNRAWDYALVQVNGTTIWENSPSVNHVESLWSAQDFDLSALADGQPSVKIRFTLHSDGSVNFGGWNLDDVKLTGYRAHETADAPPAAARGSVRLHAPTPNPTTSGCDVAFELATAGQVALDVFDVRGRHVRTIASGRFAGGEHRRAWDGRSANGAPLGAGVYFVRLTAGGVTQSRKLALLR